jgi:hypothetical protein
MGNSDYFIDQTESVLSTIVRLFALDGKAKEVAILAVSIAETRQTDYDNWNGGVDIYTLFLDIPLNIYHQILEEREDIQTNIYKKICEIANEENKYYRNVVINPLRSDDMDWREKANNWLTGNLINNQGKVRSDNIASRDCDGLLFRSEPEIFLYKAMKSLGVTFAPLPVFIRGGKEYRRIEPDFVIIKDGIVMIVEVDGDTVHQETPVEAHDRTTMMVHEGVYVERIKSSECDSKEKADIAAKKIVTIIDKHKKSK